jgi:hypothetical protein
VTALVAGLVYAQYMNHRTALIAVASVAAVGLAAAIAVALNLGILTAADSSPVGRLTTATVARDAASPAGSQAGTPAPEATVKPRRQTQEYVVRKAGMVRVAFSDKAVRFVDATSNDGWTWKLSQSGDRKLTVTFARGSDIYAFVARVGVAGKVTAEIDHAVKQIASSGGKVWTVAPAPVAPPTAATSTPSAPAASGDHSGGDHQDDEHADDDKHADD